MAANGTAAAEQAVAAPAKQEVTDAEPSSSVEITSETSPEELAKQCKRQIEFYFGDANITTDKFLFVLTHKDPQGWVPLATVASFKRMRPFKDALGLDKIAEVMRSSTELEVNEEGDKIRRTRELVRQSDAFERSVYVKGFPEETETLQKELEAFFDQFGKINSVRMRRDQNTKSAQQKPLFKGSVFVEFAERNEMQAFLEKGKDEVADADKLKYGDTVLKVMSKDAYCQMKMAEKGIDPSTVQRGPANGDKRSSTKKFNAFKELDRHARGMPSALGESEALQQRRNKREEAEDRRAKAKEGRSNPLEFDFMETKLTTQPDGTVSVEQLRFPERSVLAFKGAGAGGNWKDLKDTLATLHPTSFVEFPAGALEGAVGFKATVDDDKLKEIVDKAITVGSQPVVWSRVDEDRAKQFYLDRANFRAAVLVDQRELREAEGPNARSGGFGDRRHGGGGRGGGRGGRGGRGGGRGGRGGHRGGRDGGDHKRKRDDGYSNRTENPAPPTIASAPKKIKTDESG